MDNHPSFSVTRTQMAWAICLPLAVVVGYLLADPVTYGSMAVLVMLASVLCVPIILRWHHPLLVVLWNATIIFNYVSESIYLWMFLAVIGFLIGILNRATNPHYRFLVPRFVLWPTLFLALVTVLTALFTGGLGMRLFGSAQYGGRSYFYILFGLLGMFALASQRIPLKWARTSVFLFFLAGATYAAGNIIYMIGPVAYPLFAFFPLTQAYGQAVSESNLLSQNATRIGGFGLASASVVAAFLSIWGFRGVFGLRSLHRALLVLAVIGVGASSGFRSSLILAVMVVATVWWLESRDNRQTLIVGMGAAVVAVACVLPFVSHLPLSVQRSLSFLPVPVNPVVRLDTQASTEWRVKMWQDVLPEVPKRALVGRGYALDPAEMNLSYESHRRGLGQQWELAALTGDFHNGFLSTIIPLGGVGVLGFAWLLIAGGRVLHHNYRFGAPELLFINRFIYAYFLVRIAYFVLVFGSFYQDLCLFTGLIGLSLSLNGGVSRPALPTAPDGLTVGMGGAEE
jgi:O-antigen ligase